MNQRPLGYECETAMTGNPLIFRETRSTAGSSTLSVVGRSSLCFAVFRDVVEPNGSGGCHIALGARSAPESGLVGRHLHRRSARRPGRANPLYGCPQGLARALSVSLMALLGSARRERHARPRGARLRAGPRGARDAPAVHGDGDTTSTDARAVRSTAGWSPRLKVALRRTLEEAIATLRAASSRRRRRGCWRGSTGSHAEPKWPRVPLASAPVLSPAGGVVPVHRPTMTRRNAPDAISNSPTARMAPGRWGSYTVTCT